MENEKSVPRLKTDDGEVRKNDAAFKSASWNSDVEWSVAISLMDIALSLRGIQRALEAEEEVEPVSTGRFRDLI